MKSVKTKQIYLPHCDIIELEDYEEFEKMVGDNTVFELDGKLHFLTDDHLCFTVQR